MVNELSQRFLEALKYLIKERIVADNKDFASKISVSTSMITEISKGRSNVGLLAIQNTVLKFPISSDWLLTGQGSMLRADEPPTNSVTPSTDTPAASAKPDESILYNMYKDLQAERREKEAKIEELHAKMLAMSEEIGRLKAKLGEEASEDQPKDISKKTVKAAITKPHSSQSSPDAPSAGAPSGGR